MMESVLKQNTTVSTQLEEYQGLLRDQILILILNGNYSFDINPYLSQANILLPGPYFFVVSINFQKENAPDESVSQQMKQLFEELSDPEEEILCIFCYQHEKEYHFLPLQHFRPLSKGRSF